MKIEKFDFPENLFKFLENIGSKPVSELLPQFHVLLKTNEPELIFTMIVRQFRFLLMVKEEEGNVIGLPDWQYYKYKSQSRFFTFQELVSLYRKLLDIDHRTKTGKTPLKKDQLLDIFLSNL